jgi:hypothetical protein
LKLSEIFLTFYYAPIYYKYCLLKLYDCNHDQNDFPCTISLHLRFLFLCRSGSRSARRPQAGSIRSDLAYIEHNKFLIYLFLSQSHCVIYSAHVRLRQQNSARAMAFSPYYIQLNNVLKLYSVVYRSLMKFVFFVRTKINTAITYIGNIVKT